MANEISIIDNFVLAPVEADTGIAQALQDELGAALGAPDFARAVIPSGGMTVFSIKRGVDDMDPETVKAIDGVIVCHHPAYAYWPQAIGAESTPPDCTSTDGIEGLDRRTGEIVPCATCPYNQFGSEVREDGNPGRGKACKNGHRLYILRDGEFLPVLLALPATGLRPLKTYLQSLIIPRRPGEASLRPWQVVTRIALKGAKNAEGKPYALPTFERLGVLPNDKAAAVREYAQAFASSATRLAVEPSETAI